MPRAAHRDENCGVRGRHPRTHPGRPPSRAHGYQGFREVPERSSDSHRRTRPRSRRAADRVSAFNGHDPRPSTFVERWQSAIPVGTDQRRTSPARVCCRQISLRSPSASSEFRLRSGQTARCEATGEHDADRNCTDLRPARLNQRSTRSGRGAPEGAPRFRPVGYTPGIRISDSWPPSRLYVKSG
jgi:hypothetical protein